MAVISRITTWSDGQTLTASALNGEFNNILNDYNGGITNANISNSAGISLSKLASTPATLSGSENLTNKTLTSPIINTPTFSAGAVNTADIANAAITAAKLAAGVGGSIVQIVVASYSTEANTTSGSFQDTGLSGSITPSSASHRVLVIACMNDCGVDATNTGMQIDLIRNSTDIAQGPKFAGAIPDASLSGANQFIFYGGTIVCIDSPATTSAVTYKTQFKRTTGAGTVYVQKNTAVSYLLMLELSS